LRFGLGALVGVLALATLLPASAAGAAAEEHCAARVVEKRSSGELVLGPTTCRATKREALVAVGAGTEPNRMTTQASSTIGTHYDGANYSGSSFTVVGSSCSGGWLNLASAWDNRISSTANGCNRVIHYDGDNLSGASQTTSGLGGNLSALNNLANSIQYLV
jgi:hypothetical protein